MNIGARVQLHMTEAQRRQRWREREDGAICTTKPVWPGAGSGPAVTPATERGGMWKKYEGRGKNTSDTQSGLSQMILSAPWMKTETCTHTAGTQAARACAPPHVV